MANTFLVANGEKRYALKLIPTRSADARELLMAAYVALGSRLRKVDHDGATQIVEVFAADANRVGVVLEYVEGPSMYEAPKLSPPAFTWMLADLASMLERAHAVSLVHGNLRPQNVLLSGHVHNPKPRAINFLVAGDSRGATSGQVAARAEYLSPEQMGGEPATAASDVFSLGAIAYTAITGKAPFHGETLVESLNKHLEWEMPQLTGRSSQGFPSGLCHLVEQMLIHDPAERIGPMSRVSRKLEKIARVVAMN